MKKVLLLTSTIATLTISTMADNIGGEVAIGLWSHNLSGWIQYPTNSLDVNKIDLDSDLNLNTKSDIYIRAKVEHPIPLIPNIKVAYTQINSNGNSIAKKDFIFGSKTFPINSNITTDTQLNSLDVTLYYEIIDIGFDADVGVAFRYIDGYTDLYATGSNLSSPIHQRSSVSTIAPMLYGNIRVPLAFLDNFSIGVEGNFIAYGSNTVYDLQADVRYEFFMGFGVEAGYRMQKYKLDDIDDTNSDIDIKGFFIGAIWDF